MDLFFKSSILTVFFFTLICSATAQSQNMEKIAVFSECKDLSGNELIQCSNMKLYEFVMSNLQYPRDAYDQRIQGTVILQYEIDQEGKIQKLEVIQSVYPSLDEEALRVMSLLPVLEPAQLHGRPCSMTFNVPLQFQLEEQ